MPSASRADFRNLRGRRADLGQPLALPVGPGRALEKPAKVAFVKYTGKPGVNVLRATVHLKPEKTPRDSHHDHARLQSERQVDREGRRMQKPGDYNVDVEGEPENIFIRMAVPSKKRGAVGLPFLRQTGKTR